MPGPVPSEGFGSHIEGVSVDYLGNVYATHFRDTGDDSFDGNSANRGTIGRVDVHTGRPDPWWTGEQGSSFNGMKWDPAGGAVYVADPGHGRVVRLDFESARESGLLPNVTGATVVCGADGSLAGTGAPNDLALARNGMIFLSGQDWGTSTGGLWLCKPDGTLIQLESMNRTNGIALSPGDDYLYLTEAVGSPVPADDLSHGQVIWRYTVGPDGTVGDKTLFHDFADRAEPEASHDSDGMRTDTRGNLWVTRNGLGKVAVLAAPGGALEREVELTETVYPTNLAFGGEDGTTLYVVGRCGSSSWGTGDGCIEAVVTSSVGREWALVHVPQESHAASHSAWAAASLALCAAILQSP
jgi:sugar lactone lactonase YvrE